LEVDAENDSVIADATAEIADAFEFCDVAPRGFKLVHPGIFLDSPGQISNRDYEIFIKEIDPNQSETRDGSRADRRKFVSRGVITLAGRIRFADNEVHALCREAWPDAHDKSCEATAI
jgi:hypothetical protein